MMTMCINKTFCVLTLHDDIPMVPTLIYEGHNYSALVQGRSRGVCTIGMPIG